MLGAEARVRQPRPRPDPEEEVRYIASQDPVLNFLPKRYHNRQRDYFAYSVEYNTLAVSAVLAPQTWTVQNDSDFLCLTLTQVTTTDDTGATELDFPPLLIQINDSGSGSNWFGALQNINNVCGRNADTGPGPLQLPYPRFVKGGSQVTVQVSNLEATARRVWITFGGVKIYGSMVRG